MESPRAGAEKTTEADHQLQSRIGGLRPGASERQGSHQNVRHHLAAQGPAVLELRGNVIPIIDLHCRSDLEQDRQTSSTRIIVVETLGNLLGMVVDSASQVMRIPADQVAPPPPALADLSREYITEVAKLEDRLVILMDVQKILTMSEAAAVNLCANKAVPAA